MWNWTVRPTGTMSPTAIAPDVLVRPQHAPHQEVTPVELVPGLVHHAADLRARPHQVPFLLGGPATVSWKRDRADRPPSSIRNWPSARVTM